MKTIKNVKITFKGETQKQKKVHNRRKFVTPVQINEDGREKLKRVFSLINRARNLAIRYIKDYPDVSLNAFKGIVLDALSSKPLTHIMTAMVSQELYHIHRIGAKGIDEVIAESKSISFYEDNMTNNRFTINYRRDKIMLEDLDILLELDERIPKIDLSRHYYLNICVDNLLRLDYIYINVFYFPEVEKD